MTNEQIEKMFWDKCYGTTEWVAAKDTEIYSFTAAINLLMPIIERQQKCIEYYASSERWNHVADNPVFYLENKYEWGHDFARETLAETKKMMEGLSNG